MNSPGRLRSSSRGSFLYSSVGGAGLPSLPRDGLFFFESANRERHEKEEKEKTGDEKEKKKEEKVKKKKSV